MAYKTISSAFGQAGTGYMRGRQRQEELEEKKRQRDLQEKLTQLQMELRQMQIQKPMVTSQGIMEWQPGGDFHQPQPGADWRERPAGWGWTPHEKEQPQGLTPRQKAELDWEFDKKKWDYQVAHPKPTKGGKSKKDVPGIVEDYPKAMEQWQQISTEIRKYEGAKMEVPPQLRAEEARLRTWMQANRSAYYAARGIKATTVKPLGEYMNEVYQTLAKDRKANKITAIEMANAMAEARRVWQEAATHHPSIFETMK